MTDCQHWMTFEQPPIPETWVPYDGKGCPVAPETQVRIRRRNAWESLPWAAKNFDWDIVDAPGDITHYMIVEEGKSKSSAPSMTTTRANKVGQE